MDRPPHEQRPFSPFLRETLGWLLALHLLLALMPSLHLEQSAQKARVLLKAADTVRRHAVPLGVQGLRAVMSG